MAATPLKATPRTDAKYQHLVDHLTAQIRSGGLRAGQRLPTFVELQSAFKVTSPTVNRAMIALEQEGLVERRRGSGVYVLAPQSAPVRRATIGLAGFGFQFVGQSSYWATLLSGVREEAGESGAQILLLDYESSEGWERADGILICDWSQNGSRRHVPPALPCVSMLVAADGMAGVVADDYRGARDATEYLLQLGRRRIALLHGPVYEGLSPTGRRRSGYREALLAQGVTPCPEWERLLLWKHGYYEDWLSSRSWERNRANGSRSATSIPRSCGAPGPSPKPAARPPWNTVVEELVGPHLPQISYHTGKELVGLAAPEKGFIPVLTHPNPGRASLGQEFIEPQGWHVDGIKGTAILPEVLMLVVFAYLNDVPEYGGATVVKPGSHRQLFQHWKQRGEMTPIHDLQSAWAPSMPLPGRAGDVIFFHYLLVHSGSDNLTENIRVGLNTAVHQDPAHPYHLKSGPPDPTWTPRLDPPHR